MTTSSMSVYLKKETATPPWRNTNAISIHQDQIWIHLNETPLRRIQQAGRKVSDLGIQQVTLSGDGWNIETQWAFAKGFDTVKPGTINWHSQHEYLQPLQETIHWTKTLINKPPNEIYPESLAHCVAEHLIQLAPEHIKTTFITGKALEAEGWTGIYHVGKGSHHAPVMLQLDYNPSGDTNAPVSAVLVGKGITFDSGGYSLKPSASMVNMKCDMGGAAVLAGALSLSIQQGLNKRIRLILCCAENLINGEAYKLGDILHYKNGVSVEIVNTDAEGRLVLADGLIAAGETNAPLIIDAATLTGAAITAVGTDYNALFGLDTSLQQRVQTYANEVNEPAWPLPLEAWHQEYCPSAYADTANSRAVKGGGAGGASNAAGFLSRFVPNQGKGWVHMDLAAIFHDKATSLWAAGATAQGVRTIAKILTEEA